MINIIEYFFFKQSLKNRRKQGNFQREKERKREREEEREREKNLNRYISLREVKQAN